MIYNVVQTGPNTQLGGLKLGRIISEYHGSLNEVVVNPPIAEAINVIKRIKNKDKYGGCSVHYVTSKLDSGKIIL